MVVVTQAPPRRVVTGKDEFGNVQTSSATQANAAAQQAQYQQTRAAAPTQTTGNTSATVTADIQSQNRSNYDALQSGHITQDEYNTRLASNRQQTQGIANINTQIDKTFGGSAGQSTASPFQPLSAITNPSQARDSGGAIEAAQRARLQEAGLSADEINQRIAALKPAISDSLSTSGQGASYDPVSGRVIQGSGRLGLNNPIGVAEKKISDARQAELDQAKGYIKTTRVDPVTGATTEHYVQDQAATEQLQNDIRNRQGIEAGGMATYAAAKQDALNQMAPVPGMDAFLAGIPKENQEQAMAVFGPLFDYYEKARGFADEKLQQGINAQDEIDAATQDYLRKYEQQSSQLMEYFSQLNKRSLEGRLSSAAETYKADQAAAELQRDRTTSLYERGIRDQMIKNMEDRKNQMTGLGVSGGWRASRQTADVIGQLAKGDRVLSDLYVDAAFSEQQSAVNIQKVNSVYHQNVTTAYDNYDAANAQLFSGMMDRAAEVDKTIYNSAKDKSNAVKDLISSWLDSYSTITGDFSKSVSDSRKYAIDQYADDQKAKADFTSKTWDQTMKYIDMYGTQNKEELGRREALLGLTPGSLSNQKTIEELKMKKASGGGIYSGAQGIRTDIDTKRREFQAIYPNAGAEEIDNLVYQDFYNQYGTDSKGRAVMRDIYSQMNESPIGDQPYRIYNTAPGSTATQDVMQNIMNKIEDKTLAENYGPGQLYTYLTSDLPEKDRLPDTEAIQYIEDLGYVHNANIFLPRSWEFSKPEPAPTTPAK